MRLYLSILVSLSFWIASEAESSRVHSERHWLEQVPPPSAAGTGGGLTPAPTEAGTDAGTEDATTGGGDNAGGDSGTAASAAPTNDQVPESGTSETPSPTTTEGATPAPSLTPGSETPAPTPSQGDAATLAPTLTRASETAAPTLTRRSKTPAPTPKRSSNTPAPTTQQQPEAVYVSTDDDPLQPVSTGTEDSAAWTWKDSNVDDVEHDRTVIIALTVTFTVGVCLAIFTAQQMLENPNGCCVSLCRIFVALTCGITRCVCYPCRAICGCTNSDRRNHDIMLRNEDDYTHDLELS